MKRTLRVMFMAVLAMALMISGAFAADMPAGSYDVTVDGVKATSPYDLAAESADGFAVKFDFSKASASGDFIVTGVSPEADDNFTYTAVKSGDKVESVTAKLKAAPETSPVTAAFKAGVATVSPATPDADTTYYSGTFEVANPYKYGNLNYVRGKKYYIASGDPKPKDATFFREIEVAADGTVLITSKDAGAGSQIIVDSDGTTNGIIYSANFRNVGAPTYIDATLRYFVSKDAGETSFDQVFPSGDKGPFYQFNWGRSGKGGTSATIPANYAYAIVDFTNKQDVGANYTPGSKDKIYFTEEAITVELNDKEACYIGAPFVATKLYSKDQKGEYFTFDSNKLQYTYASELYATLATILDGRILFTADPQPANEVVGYDDMERDDFEFKELSYFTGDNDEKPLEAKVYTAFNTLLPSTKGTIYYKGTVTEEGTLTKFDTTKDYFTKSTNDDGAVVYTAVDTVSGVLGTPVSYDITFVVNVEGGKPGTDTETAKGIAFTNTGDFNNRNITLALSADSAGRTFTVAVVASADYKDLDWAEKIDNDYFKVDVVEEGGAAAPEAPNGEAPEAPNGEAPVDGNEPPAAPEAPVEAAADGDEAVDEAPTDVPAGDVTKTYTVTITPKAATPAGDSAEYEFYFFATASSDVKTEVLKYTVAVTDDTNGGNGGEPTPPTDTWEFTAEADNETVNVNRYAEAEVTINARPADKLADESIEVTFAHNAATDQGYELVEKTEGEATISAVELSKTYVFKANSVAAGSYPITFTVSATGKEAVTVPVTFVVAGTGQPGAPRIVDSTVSFDFSRNGNTYVIGTQNERAAAFDSGKGEAIWVVNVPNYTVAEDGWGLKFDDTDADSFASSDKFLTIIVSDDHNAVYVLNVEEAAANLTKDELYSVLSYYTPSGTDDESAGISAGTIKGTKASSQPQENEGNLGSSSGGCDAGFGTLALALAATLFLSKKRS